MYHAVWTINYFCAHFIHPLRSWGGVRWEGMLESPCPCVSVQILSKKSIEMDFPIVRAFKNVLACHLSFSAMSTSSFSRTASQAWFPFEDIYPVRISISVDIIIGNKHKLRHCLASFSHDTLSRLSCRCTRPNKTAIIKRVSQPSFFLSLRLYGKQQQTLKQL